MATNDDLTPRRLSRAVVDEALLQVLKDCTSSPATASEDVARDTHELAGTEESVSADLLAMGVSGSSAEELEITSATEAASDEGMSSEAWEAVEALVAAEEAQELELAQEQAAQGEAECEGGTESSRSGVLGAEEAGSDEMADVASIKDDVMLMWHCGTVAL